MYPKDTEKWKQFTTLGFRTNRTSLLLCIPKILKNESNSQLKRNISIVFICCFVSQRYWKMKAIHNQKKIRDLKILVVLYPKDTEKWKQFTTHPNYGNLSKALFCIPKILKNESNSQLNVRGYEKQKSCFVSQRYWKMKAIHNFTPSCFHSNSVVLYPKDTEKWKQFTTMGLLVW